MADTYSDILTFFREHYTHRWGESSLRPLSIPGVAQAYTLESRQLKPDNGPRLLLHDTARNEVVILTHGLSDSPFYMQAVARRFYEAGCQVIMPLLPAHGLIDPDLPMQDKHLDRKWRATVDHAVETAGMLGDRISIGGFSTGGALSLNKVLRDPASINGGLLLFSAALSIGDVAEVAGRLSFIQSITRITDGRVNGIGRDPYKYPVLPSFAGIELVQIIHENKNLLEKQRVDIPVFAAHSVHDKTAELSGIVEFMKDYVKRGSTMMIAAGVSHSSLPLAEDISLNLEETLGPEQPPAANPLFEWMMEGALRFYKIEVR